MRVFLLATAALAGSIAAARADTYSTSLKIVNDDGDGIQYNVGYSDFNQTLGSLNSATLILSGLFNAGIAEYGGFSYNPVQFDNSTLFVNTTQVGSFGTHTAAFSGDMAITYFGFRVSALLPNEYVNEGLASDILFLHGGQGVLNPQGGDVEDISTLSLSIASILYDYTPTAVVPEPASMTLLGLGILAGAKVRRRRVATA